jgi:outer membrane protein assembly factor BamB
MARRFGRQAAAVAAALALAACSSSKGPEPAPLPELVNPKEVKLLWSSDAGPGDSFTFFPAVAGDAVYVASREGGVTRLDAASGRQRWSVDVERKLSGGVGADERTVAVATEEGEVIALEAESGKVRWRARASSEVLTPPTVGAGLVLVRSIDSRVAGFGADDGKRRWVYQRSAGSLILRVATGVVILGDTAYGGFSGGKLVAIALSNGAQRWEATVALPKGANELERVTDVVGEPALQGREVCAATYQGRVACFDADNGKGSWARELSTVTGVSGDARYAYVADERGMVQAFDRSNGATVWKQEKLANRQLSLPRALGALVAFGDLEGEVHFVDRETGNFVARYSTGGGPVRAAPVVLPNGILVQTQDGGLYALSP